MNTLFARFLQLPCPTQANSTVQAVIRAGLLILAALVLSPAAIASSLNIVPVSAPEINCLFSTDCVVSPEKDRLETFQWLYNTGEGRLQSRIWRGLPGSPANGLYAYLYRVDLSGMQSQGGPGCVARVSVAAPAGALTMDFNNDGETNDHVFVITQGGPGSVGPENASASLGKIWFEFGDTQISSGVCPGQLSFFFGFVSAKPPSLAKATLEFHWLEPSLAIPAHSPGALSFGFPTQPIGNVEFLLSTNMLALPVLPPSGGGLEVALGESQGWENAFSQMQVGRANEYAITMIGQGTLGSRGQEFTGLASLWISNGVLYTSADFSGAGVSNLVVEYRDPNGDLIAEIISTSTTSCGLPLCTNIGPMQVVPVVCSNSFVSLNGEPAACWKFCQDVCAIDTGCYLSMYHQPIKTICVLGKNPSNGPVQAITNMQVLFAGLDAVTSSSQTLRWSNSWHKAEGEATLIATPRGVEVKKASIADQGGVTTAMVPANISSLVPIMPNILYCNVLPAIEFTVSVLGATTGGAQRLGSLAFNGVREGLQLTADFNPLGSTSYSAAIFLGGNEVGRFEPAASIDVVEAPERITFTKPGFTAFHPPDPGLILNWAGPVTFRPDGQRDLSGDTILLVATRPTLEVLHATSMTLLTRGISGLHIGGQYALPAVQGRLASITFGDGSVRFRSDTFPGCTYFLEASPDPTAPRSWETLESFIGNGFSRRFNVPAGRGQGFIRLRVE